MKICFQQISNLKLNRAYPSTLYHENKMENLHMWRVFKTSHGTCVLQKKNPTRTFCIKINLYFNAIFLDLCEVPSCINDHLIFPNVLTHCPGNHATSIFTALCSYFSKNTYCGVDITHTHTRTQPLYLSTYQTACSTDNPSTTRLSLIFASQFLVQVWHTEDFQWKEGWVDIRIFSIRNNRGEKNYKQLSFNQRNPRYINPGSPKDLDIP